MYSSRTGPYTTLTHCDPVPCNPEPCDPWPCDPGRGDTDPPEGHKVHRATRRKDYLVCPLGTRRVTKGHKVTSVVVTLRRPTQPFLVFDWSIVGQLLVNIWSFVGHLLIICWSFVGQFLVNVWLFFG